MPAFDESDRPLFEALHRLVFEDAGCRALVEDALARADARFAEPAHAWPYSSQPIPIEPFNAGLSAEHRAEIGLCRAFTIQAGARMPHPERHPNSVQRLCAFRGEGAVHCGAPDGDDLDLVPHVVVSAEDAGVAGIAACWDVVPANTWHFPEARGGAQWFGVAFHSVDEDTIIDEHSARHT